MRLKKTVSVYPKDRKIQATDADTCDTCEAKKTTIIYLSVSEIENSGQRDSQSVSQSSRYRYGQIPDTDTLGYWVARMVRDGMEWLGRGRGEGSSDGGKYRSVDNQRSNNPTKLSTFIFTDKRYK